MLDHLPNEILHNIFSKTRTETAKYCRLLNKKCDSLITKYGFNREHVKELTLRPTIWSSDGPSSISINIEINRKKNITFSKYEELLNALPHYLKKIGKTDALLLNRIPINRKLLHILSQQKFLRSIRKLSVCDCKVKARHEKIWFAFLEQLYLEQLLVNTTSEATFLTFPPTILDHVENVFEHYSACYRGIMEMPWLVDRVLLEWFTPEKSIYLPKAITGLTIQGIIQCIQLLPQENQDSRRNFGLLKVTRWDLVIIAMNEAGLRSVLLSKLFWGVAVYSYKIITMDNKNVVHFGCIERR